MLFRSSTRREDAAVGAFERNARSLHKRMQRVYCGIKADTHEAVYLRYSGYLRVQRDSVHARMYTRVLSSM